MAKFKPNDMNVSIKNLDAALIELESSFLWKYSPQGFDFWDNVNKQLETIREIYLRAPEDIRQENVAGLGKSSATNEGK
jgi:hypothetical protein